jgi:hypothetical protein
MTQELIEKMAQAYTGAPFPGEASIRRMTAAYAALREAMEPMGWMYEKDALVTLHTKPVPVNVRDGWTETPLYKLPEAP